MEKSMNDPIEKYRREQPTGRTSPLRAEEFGLLDYSGACSKIDLAVMHLDEGLPGGQRLRVETAFNVLRQGVEELGVWLRAAGYKT